MIRALRVGHRLIFLVAAIALPAIMVSGLRARRPVPLVAPTARPRSVPLSATVEWVTTVGQAELTLRGPENARGARAVELANIGRLRAPDLLLYWTARQGPMDKVTADDTLLGPVGAGPVRLFILPVSADGRGSLLLFSPAHQALVGTAPVPKPAASSR